MTHGNGTGDAEALRAEIRRTRAELGETVQALAARADVKGRLRDSAAHSGQRVRQRMGRTAASVAGPVRGAGSALRRPVPWAVLAAGAATVVVVMVLIRGRRR